VAQAAGGLRQHPPGPQLARGRVGKGGDCIDAAQQQANDLGIVLGALPPADQAPCDSIVVDLLSGVMGGYQQD
jgi:hypothetical protein